MGHLKILVVLLIMASDVCSRIAYARTTKLVNEDDDDAEYYDDDSEDGDEEEEIREMPQTSRNRGSSGKGGSRPQNTRTNTEEAYQEYETPEKSNRKSFLKVKSESSEGSLPLSRGRNRGDAKIRAEEQEDEYSETMKDSDSFIGKFLSNSKDEEHSEEVPLRPDYSVRNPHIEDLELGNERYVEHSEVFPLNPVYSDKSTNDDASLVQMLEKGEEEGIRNVGPTDDIERSKDSNKNTKGSVEVEVDGYDEISVVENPEPVALSKELEDLLEISSMQSGNHLETLSEYDKRQTSQAEGARSDDALPANLIAASLQPNDPERLADGNDANDENSIKESSPVIIIDSDIDVKGSGAMRRSAELVPSALVDSLIEAGNNIEELEDANVKQTRQVVSPTDEETLPEDGDNTCNLPVVTGACKGAFPRFYYSPEVKTCIPFTYTGCGQNANNFETAEDCAETCEPNRKSRTPGDIPKVKKLEFGSSATGTGIYSRNRVRRKFPLAFCNLELDLGDICPDLKRGVYLEQFFYDSRINQCAPFVYNGCGGNANRFSSMWECTQNCVVISPNPKLTVNS